MPTETTTYLLLEETRSILGPARHLVAMVALDESFDRPQWKVLHSKYGAIPTRLFPELHERILEDGILFFISQNKSLPKNQQWKSSRKSWEGLTLGGA